MRYFGTMIAVNDIATSRKFYEDLFGLEVFQDYGINVSFSCGVSIQQDYDRIANFPKEKILKEPNNMELYFEEIDFDGFLRTLKERSDIRYLHDVLEQGWGQRTVRFYDPDGHIIEVGEDIKAVIRRFLDSGMSKEETSKRMGMSVNDLEMLLAAGSP
ncbi:MAG: VOC family protein [Methanomassiliicoccaceae archaeon]|nr:VOC family protein [Methanomassiliicoccaceae archaeon]